MTRMRRWRVALGAGALMIGAVTTGSEAAWDQTMAMYMQDEPYIRIVRVVGALGMFEGREQFRLGLNCRDVSAGAVRETIEQWYRVGKIDPTDKLGTAIVAAAVSLCEQRPVPKTPATAEPKPRA